MATLPKTSISPGEYLERERKAEYKSEYCNGEVFAMAGAIQKHDGIAMQLYMMTMQHLRGKTCRPYSGDMRVLVNPSGLFTYPDLTVVCGKPLYADSEIDTLTNPTLLVEILSPSTELYDRGQKAKLYRAMPSVQELLLVSQDSYEVELYRRQTDGTWSIISATGLDASIELTSIAFTLPLRDLYEMVIAENEPR
jgi:Uma2 family endonuclease